MILPLIFKIGEKITSKIVYRPKNWTKFFGIFSIFLIFCLTQKSSICQNPHFQKFYAFMNFLIECKKSITIDFFSEPLKRKILMNKKITLFWHFLLFGKILIVRLFLPSIDFFLYASWFCKWGFHKNPKKGCVNFFQNFFLREFALFHVQKISMHHYDTLLCIIELAL